MTRNNETPKLLSFPKPREVSSEGKLAHCLQDPITCYIVRLKTGCSSLSARNPAGKCHSISTGYHVTKLNNEFALWRLEREKKKKNERNKKEKEKKKGETRQGTSESEDGHRWSGR